MLDKLGLDASLKGGLPVALKTKPGERGKFAEKTVEYAETVLMKHVAALVEKLVGMEGEATTRSQAVVDAEAALTTAAQVNDQSADALLAAENVLAEKSKELTATMRAEKALLPKSKQLNATLEVAKENLAEVQALAAKFESLCQSEGPATTAAVEEMKQMEPETVCTEDQAASVEA
ncbi:unnamed protein product [Polarella glacialis]|nr:unnamed protein product [Polarella glacialis]